MIYYLDRTFCSRIDCMNKKICKNCKYAKEYNDNDETIYCKIVEVYGCSYMSYEWFCADFVKRKKNE